MKVSQEQRLQIAAMAMQAIISKTDCLPPYKETACESLDYADELIKQFEASQPGVRHFVENTGEIPVHYNYDAIDQNNDNELP